MKPKNEMRSVKGLMSAAIVIITALYGMSRYPDYTLAFILVIGVAVFLAIGGILGTVIEDADSEGVGDE